MDHAEAEVSVHSLLVCVADRYSLQIAFNILKDVQGRYDALSYFKSALPKEDTLETNVVDLAEDWISQQYPAIIRVKALSAKDADTAFEIASKLGEEFLVQMSVLFDIPDFNVALILL